MARVIQDTEVVSIMEYKGAQAMNPVWGGEFSVASMTGLPCLQPSGSSRRAQETKAKKGAKDSVFKE
jgi:hypothetical protein